MDNFKIKRYVGGMHEGTSVFPKNDEGVELCLHELFGVCYPNKEYSLLVVTGIKRKLIEEASQQYGCPGAMRRIICSPE